MSGRKFSDFLFEFPMYNTVFAAAKATARRQKVLLTGTYGYGYDEYVDIDIVLSCEDPKTVINNVTSVEKFSKLFQLEVSGNAGYRNTDFASFKVKYACKPAVNFIVVKDSAFAKWRYATRVMRKSTVVRDKLHRTRVFEALKALCCACDTAKLSKPEIVLNVTLLKQ